MEFLVIITIVEFLVITIVEFLVIITIVEFLVIITIVEFLVIITIVEFLVITIVEFLVIITIVEFLTTIHVPTRQNCVLGNCKQILEFWIAQSITTLERFHWHYTQASFSYIIYALSLPLLWLLYDCALCRHASAPGRLDRVAAVMAIDVTLGYFYKLLVEQLPACQHDNIRCFVMDDRGYLIAHQGLIEPNGKGPLEQQHITHKVMIMFCDTLKIFLVSYFFLQCIKVADYREIKVIKI